MPAVLRMNIHKNPGISQSVFVIPALVRCHSEVYTKFSPALWCAPKHITITPIVLLYQSSEIPVTSLPVIRDPSYSEGLPEYPARVRYSPKIDASKFTLDILSDTPGVFQRLTYSLLMLRTRHSILPKTKRPFWIRGDWILSPTSTCAGPYTRKLSEQQSHSLCISFWILSMILQSIWFVQRWWRILNA